MSLNYGINLEYGRHSGLDTEGGLQKARELGYAYVEPYVYVPVSLRINTHVTLSTEVAYCHYRTDRDDPQAIKAHLDELGLKASGVSVHTQLLASEVGVPYLLEAIRFAAGIGAPVVNTDEGQKPKWMTVAEAHQLLRIALKPVLDAAEQHNVMLGIEPHEILTTNLDSLQTILTMYDSPYLKVNFDTGNAFLAGNDPVEMLKAIASSVVHVHAKDIPNEQLELRGKVTSTPLGVAVGEGVLDWKAILHTLIEAGFSGVVSVECGTPEQAKTSLSYLQKLERSLQTITVK